MQRWSGATCPPPESRGHGVCITMASTLPAHPLAFFALHLHPEVQSFWTLLRLGGRGLALAVGDILRGMLRVKECQVSPTQSLLVNPWQLRTAFLPTPLPPTPLVLWKDGVPNAPRWGRGLRCCRYSH